MILDCWRASSVEFQKNLIETKTSLLGLIFCPNELTHMLFHTIVPSLLGGFESAKRYRAKKKPFCHHARHVFWVQAGQGGEADGC